MLSFLLVSHWLNCLIKISQYGKIQHKGLTMSDLQQKLSYIKNNIKHPVLQTEAKLISSLADFNFGSLEDLYFISKELEKMGLTFSDSNMIARIGHGLSIELRFNDIIEECSLAFWVNMEDCILDFLRENLEDLFTDKMEEYIEEHIAVTLREKEASVERILTSFSSDIYQAYAQAADPNNVIFNQMNMTLNEHLLSQYRKFSKTYFEKAIRENT